jgi:hypothetical protein
VPTFQDNFGRLDGNNVDSGWNNPGAVYPNFDILGAALRVRGGIGAIVLVWDVLASALIKNQFSQATIVELGAPNDGTGAGLVIRSSVPSGGQGQGYFFDRLSNGTGWELRSTGPVTSLQFATVPDTFLAGDVLKIDCVGTTVRAWRNGAVIMTGIDPGGNSSPAAGGRVGFFDVTGVATDLIRWGGWTGGWADLGGAKIMRLRR